MIDQKMSCFVAGESMAGAGVGVSCVQPGSSVGYTVACASDEQVAAAVSSARRAFEITRRASAHERANWLNGAAEALHRESERIAQVVSEDIGKPIRLAAAEVRRGEGFLRACASAISNLGSEVLPVDAAAGGAGRFGFTRRVPFGVVAAVTPFNAPVNLLLQKLAPAVAAGNAVVVKPAPAGNRTALAMAELFSEAGWPIGLFNVVAGDHAPALALVANPGVDVVSFTGGEEAGKALFQAAGLKKFVAELGSNAANVVMPDADIANAASKITAAAFEASGQQCVSAQRILVHRAIFEPFLSAFVAAARVLKVGPANDPATDVGPMVSEAAARRVMSMCEDAIARGARYALEPVQNGCLVSPGILEEVSSDALIWRSEAFGPIALVRPFDSTNEAISLANDSPYGLQGALFTNSLDIVMRFSAEFDVGSLWINEASRFRLDMYPFGGMKRSGIGREGIRYAIEELSNLKFIGINPKIGG